MKTGTIVLKQVGSNQTLSITVTQDCTSYVPPVEVMLFPANEPKPGTISRPLDATLTLEVVVNYSDSPSTKTRTVTYTFSAGSTSVVPTVTGDSLGHAAIAEWGYIKSLNYDGYTQNYNPGDHELPVTNAALDGGGSLGEVLVTAHLSESVEIAPPEQ